jgi:hypothetical protein
MDQLNPFSPGFPTEFIRETSPWVFGQANNRLLRP